MASIEVRSESPLVVIVGPTASGKTALAIELAKKYDGEIICADSRTIYKEMDIGTAKPSQTEQAAVPHWGIDLVEPGERFTAADFQVYALTKIAEIRRRQRLPILVGGTGLYVDAVVFGYQFGADGDETMRRSLAALSLEALHNYCSSNNIKLPENKHNKRYVIRAIEQHGINYHRQHQPISTSIIVGIATEKTLIEHRIASRTEQLFDDGVVEEAIMLGKKYGWQSEAMTGNIYPLVKRFIDGELSSDALKVEFVRSDRRLAKRQMTWLRRNPHILWATRDEAEHYLAAQLDVL